MTANTKTGIGVGLFVLAFGGMLAYAIADADTSRAKQCYDTMREHEEAARLDPRVAESPYLGYYFEGCRDGCDDEGDYLSCVYTAHVYAEGEGLTYEGDVDFEAAARYSRKACDIQGEEACPGEARHLCLHDPVACEARCRDGAGADCVTLADPIDDLGTDDFDGPRAIELHGLACEADVEESCTRHRALMCAVQPTNCRTWCEEGDAGFCYQLGEALARGLGEVAQDAEKANEYKLRGCELDATVSEDCERILNTAAL